MRYFRLPILVLLLLPPIASADLQIVIVEGLGGDPLFTDQFTGQVASIAAASSAMTSADRITVFRNEDATRDNIVDFFTDLAASLTSEDQLAVFLIGHGSYDDHQYKFNISGPDLTNDDLATLLNEIPATPQLLVNTSSSSGAIHEQLAAENRIVILATRSGVERHATRFGNYFAAGLSEATADIDKNDIVTAAEAFQFAERQVKDYFERNGQLATEHPRIEGSGAARFGLARLNVQAVVSEDGEIRRLLDERDSRNAAIEALRLRRDEMTPDAYQSELLQNMLELATLEERIEQRQAELEE